MSRRPLTCRDTTWLVSDARERSLTDEEKRDLIEHISTCAYCRGASVQFEVLFRQLRVFFGEQSEHGNPD